MPSLCSNIKIERLHERHIECWEIEKKNEIENWKKNGKKIEKKKLIFFSIFFPILFSIFLYMNVGKNFLEVAFVLYQPHKKMITYLLFLLKLKKNYIFKEYLDITNDFLESYLSMFLTS